MLNSEAENVLARVLHDRAGWRARRVIGEASRSKPALWVYSVGLSAETFLTYETDDAGKLSAWVLSARADSGTNGVSLPVGRFDDVREALRAAELSAVLH